MTATGSGRGAQLQDELDVDLLEVIVAQLGGRAHQIVEVDRRAVGHAAARERQQVAHDLAGAHRFLAHELEVGLVDALRLVEHQLGAADDRLERVVDLVRHAGDELANRREPLAVHELVAQRQILGHVAFDADEVRDAAGSSREAR